jgi:hypothetical protein
LAARDSRLRESLRRRNPKLRGGLGARFETDQKKLPRSLGLRGKDRGYSVTARVSGHRRAPRIDLDSIWIIPADPKFFTAGTPAGPRFSRLGLPGNSFAGLRCPSATVRRERRAKVAPNPTFPSCNSESALAHSGPFKFDGIPSSPRQAAPKSYIRQPLEPLALYRSKAVTSRPQPFVCILSPRVGAAFLTSHRKISCFGSGSLPEQTRHGDSGVGVCSVVNDPPGHSPLAPERRGRRRGGSQIEETFRACSYPAQRSLEWRRPAVQV